MQVEIDLKYMEANSGGHGISGFRDFVPFSNTQNFPSDHGL